MPQEPLTPVVAARLGSVLVRAGVRRVRLTGGEPLLADAPAFVRVLSSIPTLHEIALTTNGERLAPLARELHDAGLSRVNVHIDSLDGERFRRTTGGNLERCLAGLAAAIEHRLAPKVNVVVQRGVNDDEVPAFCEFARLWRVPVRFIEVMDTGVASMQAKVLRVPSRALTTTLMSLGANPRSRGTAPATEYLFADGTRVGVIASESEPFCGGCNRLRLSSTGLLRTCLYAQQGLDLMEMVRRGANDEALLVAASEHIIAKRSRHPRISGAAPSFSMAAVGG